MALKIADRVRETTTTTGTGTINLGGAVTNFETFAANLSNSDTTYYAIVDNTNGDFEVGLGTFATGSPNTLARTTPISSSNSNSAVNFGAGTKEVFITTPASKMAFLNASGSLISSGGTSLMEVANDTTPQLGGNLDMNGNDIVTTSNADIDLAPNGTGIVVVKGNTNPGSIKLNCQVNTHGQTIVAQDHDNSVTNTLTLPAGGNQELVGTSATQTLTGKTFGDNVSFSDNNITNVGDIAVDSISPDGTDINVAVSDNSATAFTIKQSTNNYLVIDTGNGGESVAIGTGVSGTAISIGHTTSETTVNDNLTVTGDLTVNGDTTTVDTTNTTVKDNLLELNSGVSSNSNDSGILIERGSTGDNALIMWDESEDRWVLGTSTSTASNTGNLNMTPSFLEIGGLVMPDVTAGKILVGDNTSYQEVAMSGDVAIASNGATTIQNDAVESGMLNDNVISGQTELASGLATTDELLVSDAGTLKRMDMSVVSTFMTSEGFSKDDPTALAIALG